ncbi:uncharacterized protein VTP21DRAFT_11154 [Calcarisporiella thermophila]|uniref:uncharacterized protein n=1 Tax=Calcarisporiella thermophila TaxID=911321 RepID=UPI003743AF1B
MSVSIAKSTDLTTVLLSAAAIIGLGYFFIPSCASRKYNLPPLVSTDSFPENEKEFNKAPQKFLDRCTAIYGPVFRMQLDGREIVVVDKSFSPFITMNKNASFVQALEDITVMREFIQFPGKERHVSHLGVFVRKFLNPSLDVYTSRVALRIEEACTEFIGDDFSGEKIIDGFETIRNIIIVAASSAIVGEKLCQNPELLALFKTITTDFGMVFRAGYNKMLERIMYWYNDLPGKHLRVLERVLKPEIERRVREARENPNWERPCDMLQDLIEYIPVDNSFIHNILKGVHAIIFVSMHTTSINSSYTFYTMARFYDVYGPELITEQQEVLSSNNGISKDTLKKMVKLDSFVREALRKQNALLAIPHKALADIKLKNGFDIPKGTHIYLNILSAHFTSGDNDREFNPWRWVETSKQANKPGEDFLVFGMGAHACPGRGFAINEIKSLCSVFLRRYEFRLADPTTPFRPTENMPLPRGKAIVSVRK